MNDWVLYGVGAGLFVLIMVGLVWLVRRRKARVLEPDATYAWGEPAEVPPPETALPTALASPPPAAAPPAPTGPVHVCKCPHCKTQFSVTGNKPIVTNCPGCGKKGYLR